MVALRLSSGVAAISLELNQVLRIVSAVYNVGWSIRSAHRWIGCEGVVSDFE